MTGGEVAAAAVGKVVKLAGEQISDEHRNIKQELLSGARESPHMAEAANNYAKTIAIRQAIVTKVYERVGKWFGVATEYFEGEFNKDMAEKLKDVPEENIASPKPSVAAPAMQQLAYSLEEPDLKEMYISLLATASDNRSSEDAHPSFVEVIKQLSADETSYLNSVLTHKGILPIITYVAELTDGQGHRVLMKHVMKTSSVASGEPAEVPRLPTYVDNWIRLGLVEVDYSSFMVGDHYDNWALARPEALRLMTDLTTDQILTFNKGLIRATDFGIAFAKAVGVITN